MFKKIEAQNKTIENPPVVPQQTVNVTTDRIATDTLLDSKNSNENLSRPYENIHTDPRTESNNSANQIGF